MNIRFLLLLLLPLCSAAPLEDKKVEADPESADSHEDIGPAHDDRVAKEFSDNQLDLGNIDVSGSVTGDDILIGHQLEIDLHGLDSHAHGQDGHAQAHDGHAQAHDGHAQAHDGHAQAHDGDVHGHDGHAQGQDGHSHGLDSHSHGLDGHAHGLDGHAHGLDGHTHGHDHHVHGEFGELKEAIEHIEDDLKKIEIGREKRDADADILEGFELKVYLTISDALKYLVDHCGGIGSCDAVQIENFTLKIKYFWSLAFTGTVSSKLRDHFALLKEKMYDAINKAEAEGAVKDKLEDLLGSIPTNGGWSHWIEVSGCNATCGPATKMIKRTCTNPAPANDGLDCSGSTEETVDCDKPVCPADGGWSDWSGWSDCIATCGSATKMRDRTCTNPEPEIGGAECPGSNKEIVDCPPLSACVTDGGWSDWSDVTMCSATCGSATKMRERTCTDPAPANEGLDCVGSSQDTVGCALPDCGTNHQMIRKQLTCSSVNECVIAIKTKLKDFTIFTTINYTDVVESDVFINKTSSIILFGDLHNWSRLEKCARDRENGIYLFHKMLVYEDHLGQKWAAVDSQELVAEKWLQLEDCQELVEDVNKDLITALDIL